MIQETTFSKGISTFDVKLLEIMSKYQSVKKMKMGFYYIAYFRFRFSGRRHFLVLFIFIYEKSSVQYNIEQYSTI